MTLFQFFGLLGIVVCSMGLGAFLLMSWWTRSLRRHEFMVGFAAQILHAHPNAVRAMVCSIHDACPGIVHAACGCEYVPGPLGIGRCPDPAMHEEAVQ